MTSAFEEMCAVAFGLSLVLVLVLTVFAVLICIMTSAFDKTSAVVLGTFFGLAVVVFAKFTKRPRYAILFATSLTITSWYSFLAGGLYFSIQVDFHDSPTGMGDAISIVCCQSLFFLNIFYGFIYGFLLASQILVLKGQIRISSTAERIRRIYLESGISLQGTVVHKSLLKMFCDCHFHHALHIRYDLRPYCSSRNKGQELELGAILRSSAIETSETPPTNEIPNPSPGGFGRNYHNEEISSIYPSTIYPFQVDRQTYDESQIGDTVELIGLQGIPVSVKVKTEVERWNQCSTDFGIMVTTFFFCQTLPLMLGYYLPPKFPNWEICMKSVIIRMSIMVITAVFLVHSYCLHEDLTTLRAKKIIQEERDKMVQELANDTELQQLYDAAVTSLKKEVLRSLDSSADRTEEWKLSSWDLQILLRDTLFQAKVSCGRSIPNATIVRERDREREILESPDGTIDNRLRNRSLRGCRPRPEPEGRLAGQEDTERGHAQGHRPVHA